MTEATSEMWAERCAAAIRGTLPGYLGCEVLHVTDGEARGRLKIADEHLHPGGFVHSGAICTLADSVAAWATITMLGTDEGFATIEFKSNFFTAVSTGILVADAHVLHRGRRTIVLESKVIDQEGRLVALMIVSQSILEGVSPLERAAT